MDKRVAGEHDPEFGGLTIDYDDDFQTSEMFAIGGNPVPARWRTYSVGERKGSRRNE